MTSYRSAEEFEDRFSWRPDPVDGGFPVERYLDARGATFAARVEPRSFVTLSASIDRHAVDPGSVTAPVTLVSFSSDAIVPKWLADELEALLPNVREHIRIESVFGHDAFLKELGPVDDAIRRALDPEVAR